MLNPRQSFKPLAAAIVIAAGLHLAFMVLTQRAPVRTVKPTVQRIEVALVSPPPAKQPPPPAKPPPPPVRAKKRPKKAQTPRAPKVVSKAVPRTVSRIVSKEHEVAPLPAKEPPAPKMVTQSNLPPVEPVTRTAPAPDSLMRLPKPKTALEQRVQGAVTPSLMKDVLAAGSGLGKFAASLGQLESGLDFVAPAPVSDAKRAERVSKRILEQDLVEEAVLSGLADDYFRTLQSKIDLAWAPAMKERNDGGKATTRLGFLKDFGKHPRAFGELWEAYFDVAAQYAKGEKLHLDKARKQRLRETLRSQKGNFRVQAIAEVMLTQAQDGAILTLELPLSSGHPGIDEGIRRALGKAVHLMEDKPPERLSRGRSFRSKWRLRATWTMVPPTALASGTAWDITPGGVQMDLPFEIKLKKRVQLLTFDNRARSLSK